MNITEAHEYDRYLRLRAAQAEQEGREVKLDVDPETGLATALGSWLPGHKPPWLKD